MARFSGKTALVTGSSQGIGAACALRLASEGADVVLHGHKLDERGRSLVDQIAAMGRRARFVAADLSCAGNPARAVEDAIAALGSLDILVNNAGVERQCDFWDITEEDYDLVMDTNLKAVFFATQAFVRYCRSAGRQGVVVNMSSVHQEIVFPGFAAYCASKGALRMLTRNLASELAPLGIRVNGVAPGAIATPINRTLEDDPKLLARVVGNIQLQRMGTPEDVAAMVAFLASSDAAYVTGSTHFVDGGLTYHYTER
jgi:glucose 1-dehydrogenase